MKKITLRVAELAEKYVDPQTGPMKLSGREISRRTGIRHRTIHDMMNNRTKELPIANLEVLADFFGLSSADELLLIEDVEAATGE